jgi:inner membrane protein
MRTIASILFRTWAFTGCFTWLAGFGYSLLKGEFEPLAPFLPAIILMLVSIPVLLILRVGIHFIKQLWLSTFAKLIILFSSACILAFLPVIVIIANEASDNLASDYLISLFQIAIASSTLLAVATFTQIKHLKAYFSDSDNLKINTMENYQFEKNKSTNKILYKGLITGALILIMLIPASFLSNLVKERQERQKVVVEEVAKKWSDAQTIAPPYIFIPYKETVALEKNLTKTITKELIFLPEQLDVRSNVITEERKRSIYKVLLYRSAIDINGKFKLQLPEGINFDQLVLNDAKICVGLTDFKGVEEQIKLKLTAGDIILKPGLPTQTISKAGLSGKINLDENSFKTEFVFNTALKIKGSEDLQFLPLSANSIFSIRSQWKHPSFNGNFLPANTADINDKGFNAIWKFNPANLPFNNVLVNQNINPNAISFGVSMVQPANHYTKTDRSVKYALLFIGLTFALFFITELLQKKEVHPLQYTLVGFALLIFYSLLLSLSEFIPFTYAYITAAAATAGLITVYSYSHFRSIKIAAVFAAVIGGLYAFIFVLINLEDTALLVGSIGLFIILAIIMYLSKKINWHDDVQEPILQQ